MRAIVEGLLAGVFVGVVAPSGCAMIIVRAISCDDFAFEKMRDAMPLEGLARLFRSEPEGVAIATEVPTKGATT